MSKVVKVREREEIDSTFNELITYIKVRLRGVTPRQRNALVKYCCLRRDLEIDKLHVGRGRRPKGTK